MTKKKEFRSKAIQHVYDRYVGDDPEAVKAYEDELLNAKIAQQIYERRLAAGLTQRELAERIDTQPSVISRLEDADYDGHSLNMLKRIAEALDEKLDVRIEPKNTEKETRVYPVFFTYEEIVKGNGFLSGVQARGRALMVHDDDEWVMYGVQPGSLTEYGGTFEEARLLFRQAFRELLYDSAEKNRDFKSFKTQTERILREVNGTLLERWETAVETIRANTVPVEEPLHSLPIVRAQETAVEVHVVQLVPANTSADNRSRDHDLARAA